MSTSTMVFTEKKTSPRILSFSKQNEKSPFFYDGGGRSKILNQILHCVRFSPGVIALTGPTGSGRTLLMQSLLCSFKEEESDVCFLSEDNAVLETEEELYRALAEGFGLEQKSIEVLDDLADRVQHFIRVGLRAKRNLLIAIDDAKQHSEEVLETLLQLVGSNKGLSLLLSGEASLLETLKQFHVRSLMIHQIALRPLLTEEVSDFLQQYLKRQGFPAESALNRKKLDELMSRTGGNLSLLVREAKQLVVSLQTSNKRTNTELPVVHIVALVVVITVTTLAFLYYPSSEQQILNGQLNPSSVEAVGSSFQENSPVPVVASAEALDESSNIAGESVSAAVKEIGADTVSKSISEQPVLPPKSEAVSAAIEVTEPPQQIEPLSSPVSPYTLQEQALLNRPSRNIVLQVSSLNSEKMANRFIQQCAPEDAVQLSYYRRGTKDKSVYVVIYGDYSNKEAAMSALKKLPDVLKKSAPWPRTLTDIQRELKMRP